LNGAEAYGTYPAYFVDQLAIYTRPVNCASPTVSDDQSPPRSPTLFRASDIALDHRRSRLVTCCCYLSLKTVLVGCGVRPRCLRRLEKPLHSRAWVSTCLRIGLRSDVEAHVGELQGLQEQCRLLESAAQRCKGRIYICRVLSGNMIRSQLCRV
jgi:hypothetical protein